MSFDQFWRLPAPWNEVRLAAAIEEAARLFPGARIRHARSGRSLRVIADWPGELVRQHAVNREEQSAGSGELSLAAEGDDEADGFDVRHLPTRLQTGKRRARAVLGLAVRADRLATHGFGAALYCVGDGGLVATFSEHSGLEPLSSGGPTDGPLDRVAMGAAGQLSVASGERAWRLVSSQWQPLGLAELPATEPYLVAAATSVPGATSACRAHDGTLWVGTEQGALLRSVEGRWLPVDTGGAVRVQALVAVADHVVAAVQKVEARPAGPGLLLVVPDRHVSMYAGSSFGGNRESWGVTTELGAAITRIVGGMVLET